MKKYVLAVLLLIASISFAQDKEAAGELVKEGVALHNKGDLGSALSKYDQALQLDKDNLAALAEKAITLVAMEKYDEVIKYCQRAIETHPGEKELNVVYVAYGNAADALGKTDLSLKIYDQGIKQFPDYYQLHFNKGISLASIKKYDDAMLSLQKSVQLNPEHGGSHNAIGWIAGMDNKRIPTLLAYCRLLSLEQKSSRAKQALSTVQKIVKGSAEKTGEKSVTINITPDMLTGATKKGKPRENDFSTTDMLLSLGSALDYDDTFKNEKEVERFIRKLQAVCTSLQERNKNYGFFWDYYAPYFADMKEKKFIETFAYIAFASSENQEISAWLTGHQPDVEKFTEWSSSFEWKTK